MKLGSDKAPDIAKLKSRRKTKQLVQALGHGDAEVREDAAEALGEIGDIEAKTACLRASSRLSQALLERIQRDPSFKFTGDFMGEQLASEHVMTAWARGAAKNEDAHLRAQAADVARRSAETEAEAIQAHQQLLADHRMASQEVADATYALVQSLHGAEDLLARIDAADKTRTDAGAKGSDDQSRCAHCHREFPTPSPGFAVAADPGLSWRQGCDSCGVPVCFNCAAREAEDRGMRGSCVCPSCGETIDG